MVNGLYLCSTFIYRTPACICSIKLQLQVFISKVMVEVFKLSEDECSWDQVSKVVDASTWSWSEKVVMDRSKLNIKSSLVRSRFKLFRFQKETSMLSSLKTSEFSLSSFMRFNQTQIQFSSLQLAWYGFCSSSPARQVHIKSQIHHSIKSLGLKSKSRCKSVMRCAYFTSHVLISVI